MMKTTLTCLGAALAVMLIGGGIGVLTLPGEWYATLNKPFFTPPNWLFGPVWTTLYAMIGVVGARKWLRGGAVGLWWGQMVLNFLWSPVFFGLQMPLPALGIIAAIWGLIALFIRCEWRSDRVSALLFVPYLAWVSLATALNAAIVVLN
jgi:benzodiazapine receptor